MKEKYVVLTIFVVIIAHVYGRLVVIPYIIIYYGLTFFLSMLYLSL
ncbi:NADH-quinone oxidoreductase subunit A [Prevotella pallens ATCC 700821]|uniref:NADH-quinone oxidoreductase subunit A n=1 Tax=Prevotella pallens ATCC 700821 TaxID=997353 RepID=F9DJI6_9BACT|nr:NADH-quinone oxidoreductase subunit A [Prevotella pallens ATCC 700821]